MDRFFKTLFLLLFFFSGFSQAQNILVATTVAPPYGDDIVDNIYNEFVNYSGGTVTDARRTLGIVGPNPSFAGYDIVVVSATYNQLLADELADLITAINSQSSTAFVLFFDGCNQCGSNASDLVNILNTTNDVGISASLGTPDLGNVDYLTTGSTLAAGFVSPLVGYDYTPFLGIPSGNTIYTDNISSADGAGFIIPIQESKGSCLFGMADTSPFDLPTFYPANEGKIAPAFVNAATNKSGACFLRGTYNGSGPQKIPSLSLFGLIAIMLSLVAVAYKKAQKI